MPTEKDRKRLIRARMARTGESYSTARRHLLRATAHVSVAGTERTHAMRFEATIEDGRRIVAACDVPADYRHNLTRGLGFSGQRDRDRFVWEYPADAPGWEDAARNWEAHGPEMLDQGHGVAPVDWEAGLAWIADAADRAGADWFVVGSAALAARGVDVAPGNVDIAMDEAGADRLAPHIGDGVMKPVVDSGGWPVATRQANLFHGCGISVIGGLLEQDHPTLWDEAARATLDTVTWRGRAVRVPTLDLHVWYARGMFRNDHVRAIMAYRAKTATTDGG